jgi:hypothetical protein
MRLGAADLATLLVLLVVAPAVTGGVLSDPGLGWHLRVPDAIFADGFPTADPFSDPPGRPWKANQWLGELPFWAGWKVAGWNGVAAVSLGLIALTYRPLFGWLQADGVAWPIALLLAVFAASAGFVGWLARPTQFTTLFAAIVARAVVRFHADPAPSDRLRWLPLVFLIWVNCHGGFVAGLATVGAAAAAELALWEATSDRRAMKRGLTLLAALAASSVATLANPYGWRVYPWVFGLLGDAFFMNLNQEWLSPDFHAAGFVRVEVLFLALVGLLAVSGYRPNWVEVAVVLAWTHLALNGRRYTPVWVAVALPLVGRLLAGLPGVSGRAIVEHWRELWGRELPGGWLGPVLLVAGLAGWAAVGPRVEPASPVVPEAGLDRLLQAWQPGEAVFHSPNHGGWLTFRGWPRFRTTIDDRNEVHGRASYERFLATQATDPGWEANLVGVTWVAVDPGTPLAHRLAERPGEWAEFHCDPEVVIFRRVNTP